MHRADCFGVTGPERGFRAASKGRQGGPSRRRGLVQLLFGRGTTGEAPAGRGSWSRPVPAGVSLLLAPAVPVVLRSEGQDKGSWAPPWHPAHNPWAAGVQSPWGVFLGPNLDPGPPSPLPCPEDTPFPKTHAPASTSVTRQVRDSSPAAPTPQWFCHLTHASPPHLGFSPQLSPPLGNTAGFQPALGHTWSPLSTLQTSS